MQLHEKIHHVDGDLMHDTQQNASWVIPEDYLDMPSNEQSELLRTCILRFLKSNGPTTASTISKEIGASNSQSVPRMLSLLTATRQIYSETYGPKTTIYYPNGSLAHPLLQANIKCPPNKEYTIRTYSDRMTGKYLTITEYNVSYNGERKPQGGIKIDLSDIGVFISELNRIFEGSKNSEVVDRGLVTTK